MFHFLFYILIHFFMSDRQNDIACLDILTKCIKLMDLQGYMTSMCLLLSEKKIFLKLNHNKQDLSSR